MFTRVIEGPVSHIGGVEANSARMMSMSPYKAIYSNIKMILGENPNYVQLNFELVVFYI